MAPPHQEMHLEEEQPRSQEEAMAPPHQEMHLEEEQPRPPEEAPAPQEEMEIDSAAAPENREEPLPPEEAPAPQEEMEIDSAAAPGDKEQQQPPEEAPAPKELTPIDLFEQTKKESKLFLESLLGILNDGLASDPEPSVVRNLQFLASSMCYLGLSFDQFLDPPGSVSLPLWASEIREKLFECFEDPTVKIDLPPLPSLYECLEAFFVSERAPWRSNPTMVTTFCKRWGIMLGLLGVNDLGGLHALLVDKAGDGWVLPRTYSVRSITDRGKHVPVPLTEQHVKGLNFILHKFLHVDARIEFTLEPATAL
jgi:hypothetical protein